MPDKKSATELPGNLKKALSGRSLAVYRAMRPSCRRDYAERARKAAASSDPAARLATVLRAIVAYGKRHPDKLKRA